MEAIRATALIQSALAEAVTNERMTSPKLNNNPRMKSGKRSMSLWTKMLSICGGNSLFPIALSDCRWAIHLWEIGVREV